MCLACGVPTHIPAPDQAEPVVEPFAPAKFAALRNPSCRVYLVGGMLSMMADNIEHVITYWVLWQRFHSTALTGFEVINTGCRSSCCPPISARWRSQPALPPPRQGAQLPFRIRLRVCRGVLFVNGCSASGAACAC